MIACRTKGIPMKAGTHIDAEGFHCFNLDEKQHDPFAVLQRLIDAANKVAGIEPKDDPKATERFERIILAREQGCPIVSCDQPQRLCSLCARKRKR